MEVVQTFGSTDPKKHSVRFNADGSEPDPAVSSVYVSNAALAKLDVKHASELELVLRKRATS
jgi:hypothetical protein